MKRISLTLIIILCAFMLHPAKAQYFHHEYGGNIAKFESGINTVLHAPGHVLCGVHNPNGAASNDLIVTYTDKFGVPVFNRTYTINNGTPGFLWQPQIVEIPAGFAIIGVDNSGIFYFTIDALGNPLGTVSHWFTAGSNVWSLARFSRVCKSIAGTEIYFTGTVFDNSFDAHMFVGKIDLLGNLQWGQIYDMTSSGFTNTVSFDLIESPYSPSGPPELVVVGVVFNTLSHAYFMRIDATNGAPISMPIFFGPSNYSTGLMSIDLASSGSAGGQGFVVGGFSDMNAASGSSHSLLMKLSPTGNILWSYTYEYGLSPGVLMGTEEVMERLNTSSNYEYFAAGHTGANEIVVLKVDDMGTPYTLGEFTYHVQSYGPNMRLDQYSDGISIFSDKSDPMVQIWDMHHIKAYFNGRSGCNNSFADPVVHNGPGTFGETQISTFGGFNVVTNMANALSTSSDVQNCYRDSIRLGDNSVPPTQEEGEGAFNSSVSPNPYKVHLANPTLTIESKEATAVSVRLYDLMGRELYADSFTIESGMNHVPLNWESLRLASGIYSLQVSNGQESNTLHIVVD